MVTGPVGTPAGLAPGSWHDVDMRILQAVGAVVVGIIVGSIVMMGIHFVTVVIYPVPEGLDMYSSDPEMQKELVAWMASLPVGAWLLGWLAHAVGCLSAASVAMLIAGRRSLVPALFVGAWFTLGGILNAVQLQAPVWFYVIDVPVYLLGAFAVGKLLRRSPAPDA